MAATPGSLAAWSSWSGRRRSPQRCGPTGRMRPGCGDRGVSSPSWGPHRPRSATMRAYGAVGRPWVDAAAGALQGRLPDPSPVVTAAVLGGGVCRFRRGCWLPGRRTHVPAAGRPPLGAVLRAGLAAVFTFALARHVAVDGAVTVGAPLCRGEGSPLGDALRGGRQALFSRLDGGISSRFGRAGRPSPSRA